MYAIVPAAGNSSRMGLSKQDSSKVLMGLGGRETVLSRTLSNLISSDAVNGVVVACREEDIEVIKSLLSKIDPSKDCYTVLGGKERQDSVYSALKSLKDKKPNWVMVHDAARPMCSAAMITSVAERAIEKGSAILGIPSVSTLKRVAEGEDIVVKETISRDSVWEAQTPQAFSYAVLLAAHERAIKDGVLGTDDSSLVERLGHQVSVVTGSRANIKITTPEDIEHVQSLIQK